MLDFLYGPAMARKPRAEFLGALFYDGPQQPPPNPLSVAARLLLSTADLRKKSQPNSACGL
jgi:hypothetical protein